MVNPTGRLRLGPGSGRLLLHTRREGVAAKVGHDLTIEVRRWSALVDVPPTGGGATTHVSATVDLDSLYVVEGTGGAVPLTDADRRKIAQNAHGILDVDSYPTASFESASMEPAPGGGTITGMLRLHGSTGPVPLSVREEAPGRYRATASVSQTAYGIKPYSAFLGTLKLRDQVQVECEVDLGAAEQVAS